MATKRDQQVIAIEEHYFDPELTQHFSSADEVPSGLRQRLEDVGELRLREMDEAGIDIQVLSHAPPGTQRLDPDSASLLAAGVNDRLASIIKTNPQRFAGLASLPTPDAAAAADELERCVNQLGFKGAIIHGLTNGTFFDDKKFWPIFERAASLDVPIYIHPALPHPAVVDTYYQDYLTDYPGLETAAWGFTVETATAAIRIVLSGVLEKYPGIKIILGHLGEGIPFLLWRIDHALSRPGNKSLSFRDVFSEHFYVTTSGNFSDPALLCSIQEMGVDRILFSVDWPFVANDPGVEWMESLHLNNEDKTKILSENAKRILHIS
ncbi:MAG: amidohydrolase [Rhodospirillales bacterium]|nr:amidohydrolase [Rhodospirillales bacterium]